MQPVKKEDGPNWMDKITQDKNYSDIILWGIIAIGYLIGLTILMKLHKIGVVLFFCGCVLGMFWEIPLSFPGWYSDPKKLLKILTPKYFFMLLPYFFWDGFILMVGYWAVKQFLSGPHFVTYNWQEFMVYFVWGQISSLAVEVFAGVCGLWSYKVSKWNPALFRVSNNATGVITLLPQLIWMTASTIFYFLTLYFTGLYL